ncbi:unnamed protein product [Meloidogyne enterolobii]|uniref:Uncharacterized protein n=2 Tax=Meloidogyne enterolobii TaxID=390850 RepID=A0ACB0YRW4_MELEN
MEKAGLLETKLIQLREEIDRRERLRILQAKILLRRKAKFFQFCVNGVEALIVLYLFFK